MLVNIVNERLKKIIVRILCANMSIILTLQNVSQHVHVDSSVDPRAAVWTGLSVVGALNVTLHCNPVFEVRGKSLGISTHYQFQGEPIGAYVTAADFQDNGASCALTPNSRLFIEGSIHVDVN